VTGQAPSVGRIVHYRLTEKDVNDIFVAHGTTNRQSVRAGDTFPAMVVAIFAAYKSVNAPAVLDLSVFVPGGHLLAVEEIAEGTEQGQWLTGHHRG
jgi:hypothetical protein